MRELHGEEQPYTHQSKDVGSQMRSLVNLLNQINDLTKNNGIKELLNLKRTNLNLMNENEHLKKENKRLISMLKQKDKEMHLIDNHMNFGKIVRYVQ